MKEETKKQIFKILEPVVEFLTQKGVNATPTIVRGYYGGIKIDDNYSNEIKRELYDFVRDKNCDIFDETEWLNNTYIIFSFIIDGKWSHAWG